jgi:hypothetical protein
MPFSYLAVFFLFLIIIFAIPLLAPFHLFLNLGKKGTLVEGSIKLAWLGRTLMKAEISPQSASDLLASRWEEKAGEEREENEIDNRKENQKARTVRSPSIQSLIIAAPALAKIIRDLISSIHFKISTCRLCFGLNDPAQTAIISGYLWFLASVLGLFPAKIFIEPWFEGERLEGELKAEIEARLLWAFFALIQILRVREIRLLIKEMLGWA